MRGQITNLLIFVDSLEFCKIWVGYAQLLDVVILVEVFVIFFVFIDALKEFESAGLEGE